MSKHIMVDLETLSTKTDACILSIGAVEFDDNGLGKEFYQNVDFKTCKEIGMRVDKETVDWWKTQPDAIKQLNKDKVSIQTALERFRKAFFSDARQAKVTCVWGNGARFDNAILGNAYFMSGSEPPWKFWNDRCYRTVKGIFGSEIKIEDRVGTYHNALDDAKTQAIHLIKMMED